MGIGRSRLEIRRIRNPLPQQFQKPSSLAPINSAPLTRQHLQWLFDLTTPP